MNTNFKISYLVVHRDSISGQCDASITETLATLRFKLSSSVTMQSWHTTPHPHPQSHSTWELRTLVLPYRTIDIAGIHL